jgi:hypothetical protein
VFCERHVHNSSPVAPQEDDHKINRKVTVGNDEEIAAMILLA